MVFEVAQAFMFTAVEVAPADSKRKTLHSNILGVRARLVFTPGAH